MNVEAPVEREPGDDTEDVERERSALEDDWRERLARYLDGEEPPDGTPLPMNGSTSSTEQLDLLPQSLTSFLAEPAPDVRFLVPGLIEAGTLGVLAAPPNGAKTWATLRLAKDAAERGHRVLLIPEEGAKARYQYRCRANGLTQLVATTNKPVGKVDILWKKGLKIEGQPWDVLMPSVLAQYELVFIDPLGYAHSRDESNQQEMNGLWGVLKQWRDDTVTEARRYGTAIWPLHYTTKNTWPKEAVPALAHIHGSNVITRYVDAAIIIKTIGEEAEHDEETPAPAARVDHFEVHAVKLRDGALPDAISMDLHQVRALESDGREAVDEDGSPVFTARVELGGLAWKAKRDRAAASVAPEVLETLLGVGKPLTASAIREAWKKAHDGRDINPKKTLQPALKWLKGEHLVAFKPNPAHKGSTLWEPTLKAKLSHPGNGTGNGVLSGSDGSVDEQPITR